MKRFSINGRFFNQKPTGVQRYGAEVTRALDVLVAERSDMRGKVITAPGSWAPRFTALTHQEIKGPAHAAWEQTRLPRHADGTLLCFGNTGPVAFRNKVVCIHDANVRLEPQSFSTAFRTYMRVMTPLVTRTSRAIVTVSPYSRQMLQETGISRNRDVLVAPNGHEHALRWEPGKSSVAATYGLDRPFILLVGSLARHKNWAVIARIAGEIEAAGIDIVACGAGGAEFSPVDQPGLSRFKMLGRVSDDDLAWLYRHAVCLAFPSLVEGFGIPLVEAMALDCPIISSNASCMPSIGGDAVVLLDPHDPSAWLEAIQAFAASPPLRDEYIGRGREQRQQFSWRRSAQIYMDLIE